MIIIYSPFPDMKPIEATRDYRSASRFAKRVTKNGTYEYVTVHWIDPKSSYGKEQMGVLFKNGKRNTFCSLKEG